MATASARNDENRVDFAAPQKHHWILISKNRRIGIKWINCLLTMCLHPSES